MHEYVTRHDRSKHGIHRRACHYTMEFFSIKIHEYAFFNSEKGRGVNLEI